MPMAQPDDKGRVLVNIKGDVTKELMMAREVGGEINTPRKRPG